MSDTRRDLLGCLLPFTRALRRIEDRAAAEEGLTMWQYAILAVLDQAEQTRTGDGTADHVVELNQRTLAQRMDYSRNRIIADLDLLEEQSLLVRRAGNDRRSNALSVTPSGTARMKRIRSAIHRGEDALLVGLPTETRLSLAQVSAQLADHLRERSTAVTAGGGSPAATG